MGIVARLRKGSNILDLSSGHFALMPGFAPPSAQELTNLSSGTSANRTGGSSAVSKTGGNFDWAFQVRIMGSKVKEIDAQAEILDYFLRQAGNDAEPLYFEFRSETDFSFEPRWGQYGVFKKLEIVSGGVTRSNLYGEANLREKVQTMEVGVQVKPYIIGQSQLVGRAIGYVRESTIGKADGISRGTMFCPDTTNKMTNPVFGHSTWNNAWTASDASLLAIQNTDKRFYLFEKCSAILSNTSTSTARNYYQSINVGGTSNHTLSFYVKKVDSSEVTSSDCVAYYGSTQTTTFTSVGDGWYRAQATMAGVNASTSTGVQVKAKMQVCVDAFQIEQAAGAKPFLYGEMLGCAWTGTAHASTSSAGTGGHVHFPSPNENSNFGNLKEGTIQVVWKADHTSNVFGTNEYLFHDASGMYLRWTTSGTKWTFSDGTNAAESSSTSYSDGDILVFHALYSTSGLQLYVNGSSVGTNGTYAPNAVTGTNTFVIGADSAGATPIKGTFMGFTVFDRKLSSTEVAAAYASVYQIANDGVRVDCIPWAWTNDGDMAIDYYTDSTHFDHFIAAGIPGTAPADTILDMSTTNGRSLVVSNNVHTGFVDQADLMNDQSGTVGAGSVGGQYYQFSLSSTEAALQTTTTTVNFEGILGKKVYLFMALADPSSIGDLYCRPSYTIGDTTAKGEWQAVTVSSPAEQFLIGPITVTTDDISRFDWVYNGTMTFCVYGKRTGTGANVQVDFVRVLPGYTSYIYNATSNGERIILHGRGAYCYNSSDFNGFLGVRGDLIELEPNRYNHVAIISGDLEGAETITTTTTVTYLFVTPRYHLL